MHPLGVPPLLYFSHGQKVNFVLPRRKVINERTIKWVREWVCRTWYRAIVNDFTVCIFFVISIQLCAEKASCQIEFDSKHLEDFWNLVINELFGYFGRVTLKKKLEALKKCKKMQIPLIRTNVFVKFCVSSLSKPTSHKKVFNNIQSWYFVIFKFYYYF